MRWGFSVFIRTPFSASAYPAYRADIPSRWKSDVTVRVQKENLPQWRGENLQLTVNFQFSTFSFQCSIAHRKVQKPTALVLSSNLFCDIFNEFFHNNILKYHCLKYNYLIIIVLPPRFYFFNALRFRNKVYICRLN